MVGKIAILHDKITALHAEFMGTLIDCTEQIKGKKFSQAELVDIGFLLRECESLFDDWRKDCKARKELAGKLAALVALQGTDMDCTIEGRFATGTPHLKMVGKPPGPGTIEYSQLCEFLGIPVSEFRGNLVRFSWNGLSKVLTELAEQGRQVPPGILDQWPEYSTVFRRKSHGSSKD